LATSPSYSDATSARTRGYQTARIIISKILNRERAWTACDWCAGISIISPADTLSGVPAMVMSASPSSPGWWEQ
jgi:hypothetical protein